MRLIIINPDSNIIVFKNLVYRIYTRGENQGYD